MNYCATIVANRGYLVLNKQAAWLQIVGMIFGLYKAFVLQNLWNWFVVRALQVPRISFWLMLGVLWTIQLLTETSDGILNDLRWRTLPRLLEELEPADKQGAIVKTWDRLVVVMRLEVVLSALELLAGYTFTLGVGWLVQEFLVK